MANLLVVRTDTDRTVPSVTPNDIFYKCLLIYCCRCSSYRTPRVAAVASLGVWVVSFAVMFPVVLYADHVPQPNGKTTSGPIHYSCQVQFPIEHGLTAVRAYVAYTAVVGFLLPVAIITSLYAMLVARLRTTRRHIRSGVAKAKSLSLPHRRNVTSLVAVVIAVFVVCWLPYWIFQVDRHTASALKISFSHSNLSFVP